MGHYQAVTRPEPTWRTLRLVDGRLWIGDRPRFLRRPRARLEPDVLALVDPDGFEAGYRWDDYVVDVKPLAQGWRLHGARPSRGSIAAVWLLVGDGSSKPATRRRLAGRPLVNMVWEEIPALAAYLATTPTARPGLARPERTADLITELTVERWRRPRPLSAPLFGDRLYLHLAVVAVLDAAVALPAVLVARALDLRFGDPERAAW